MYIFIHFQSERTWHGSGWRDATCKDNINEKCVKFYSKYFKSSA